MKYAERHVRLDRLRDQIDNLERQIKTEELLEDIWLELGPYTNALPEKLQVRLQEYFGFDDSE